MGSYPFSVLCPRDRQSMRRWPNALPLAFLVPSLQIGLKYTGWMSVIQVTLQLPQGLKSGGCGPWKHSLFEHQKTCRSIIIIKYHFIKNRYPNKLLADMPIIVWGNLILHSRYSKMIYIISLWFYLIEVFEARVNNRNKLTLQMNSRNLIIGQPYLKIEWFFHSDI